MKFYASMLWGFLGYPISTQSFVQFVPASGLRLPRGRMALQPSLVVEPSSWFIWTGNPSHRNISIASSRSLQYIIINKTIYPQYMASHNYMGSQHLGLPTEWVVIQLQPPTELNLRRAMPPWPMIVDPKPFKNCFYLDNKITHMGFYQQGVYQQAWIFEPLLNVTKAIMIKYLKPSAGISP